MAEGRMNLSALQQRDPYITDIVDTASQVALYLFNREASTWEKTEIEGSLFVYKRSASPTHGFMILNRLGLTNQIDPITKDMEYQLQEPFLLYKTSKDIYGIWFYESKECVRIGHKIQSFLQETIKNHNQKAALRNRRASESDSTHSIMAGKQVNIMQMLSKAQDEYDKSKKKPDPKPFIDNPNASATKSSELIRPRPMKAKAEETEENKNQNARPSSSGPLTLETLFRNASLQQSQDQRLRSQTSVVETSKPPPTFHRSLSVTDAPQTQESSDVPALLKHIMSSGSMVEDIERQQRGETTPPNVSDNNDNILKVLTQTSEKSQSYQRESDSSQTKEPKWFLSDSNSQSEGKRSQDFTKLGDSLTINRYSDSAIRGGSPSDNISAINRQGGLPKTGRVGSAELLTPAALEKSMSSSSEKINSASKLSAAAASLNTDVLLSPMAFVRGSQKSPASSLSDEPLRLNRSNDSGSSTEGSTGLPIAALTKEQLQQAMMYLIKSDSSFINTLHEAYLNSLKELSKS